MRRKEALLAVVAFAVGIICASAVSSLIRPVGNKLLGLGPATIWKEEVRSPDGFWLAIGLTEQQGGPGNAGCDTTVSLKRTNVSEDAMEVLGFSCGPVGKAYTLDNIANGGGTIGLSMKWLDPSHLEVTYDSRLASEFYFQVVRTSGIEIAVKDTPQLNIGSEADQSR